MNEALWAISAFLLPWVVGMQCCRLMLSYPTPWVLCCGVGYFVGYVVTAGLLWFEYLLTGSISFWMPAISLASVGAIVWVMRKRLDDERASRRESWSRELIIAAGVLGIVIVAPGVADVWFRPLFPWDAWYTYGLRAKVFVHFQAIVDFVSQHEWRENSSEGAFNTNVRHGNFVPLVQTWIALGLGRWSESIVNLPWVGAWVALSLTTAGTVRYAGHTQGSAFLAGAAVLTLPMTVIFAVIAGYTELWLAGLLTTMLAMLIILMKEGAGVGPIIIASIGLAGAAWTKNFGAVIALILLIAWALSLFYKRFAWYAFVALIIICSTFTYYLALGAPIDFYFKIEPFGTLGFNNATLYLPGIRTIPIEQYTGNFGEAVGNIFFSPSFALIFWICIGFIVSSASRVGISSMASFLMHWTILCSFGIWNAFSYTYLSTRLADGTIHERALFIAIIITFLLGLCGIAAPKSNSQRNAIQ